MKKAKKILCLLLLVSIMATMAGCGAESQEKPDTQDSPAPQVTAEEQKPVILVVSFGTSFNDNRELSIGAVEEALAKAYPQYEIRRAFTSQIVIDILAERDGIKVDNVQQAMDRLVADAVQDVLVMPTHVMEGFEYDDVAAEISSYADKFHSLKLGHSLLGSDADYAELAQVLAKETESYSDEKTAVVFMGHGTHHESNSAYGKLQEAMKEAGLNNYFVGTVEGSPLVEDVLDSIQGADYDKVVLLPLMIVAGDHANNDMAGDEEGSWKDVFSKAGYEVECVLKGLGQYEGVQKMIVEHAAEAMAAEAPVTEEPAEEAMAAGEQEKVLAPVGPEQLCSGSYEISLESSSSMFNVVKCVLTVEDGSMRAAMTMSGDGYGKLYMGSGEEALAADESSFIPFVLDEDGAKTFTVPVEQLNTELKIAAWSIKKEQWYDRDIVFLSDMLPEEAFAN